MTSSDTAGEPHGPLKAPHDGPQDAWSSWLGGARQGKLRLRTLVALRWLAIGGQVAAVLVVGLGLGYHVPYALCFSLIALSAWLNVLFCAWPRPASAWRGTWRRRSSWPSTSCSSAAVLFLTGGALNPFCILLIAPVALAAATLPLRHAAGPRRGWRSPCCWRSRSGPCPCRPRPRRRSIRR